MVLFDITVNFKQNKQRFSFTVILKQIKLVPTQLCQYFKFTGCVSPDERLG